MTDSLILIGKSGAMAARSALETTGQNIANAATEGYQRRGVQLSEVASTGGIGLRKDSVLSGVRVSGIARSGANYLYSEARRTGSDAARVETELATMRRAETALEQSGLYSGLVEFEASLAQLAADPLDGSARTAVVEGARTLASAFNIADGGLTAAGEQARFEAGEGAGQVNRLATELARTNVALARTDVGGGAQATLLDRRDALLAEMSGQAGISVSFDAKGVADVRLGDASGPSLVSGGTVAALEVTTAADGTISFAVDGAATTITSGALAGQAQALDSLADQRGELDALAVSLIALANDAQANGIDPDGNPGAPLFSGNAADDIAVALADGSGIATAPAGAGTNSRDISNLTALRNALSDDGPTAAADRLLFNVSSAIAGREITAEALGALSENALATLGRETEVDLDAEAANLLRFQQAFQASSRVIQVSSDIFDTLLSIR